MSGEAGRAERRALHVVARLMDIVHGTLQREAGLDGLFRDYPDVMGAAWQELPRLLRKVDAERYRRDPAPPPADGPVRLVVSG